METFPRREIDWREKQGLETKVEQLIKQDVEKLLAKLQRLNTDPAGFGGKFRISYPREWAEFDWREVYPTADFSVNASFTIKDTGLYR